MDKFITDEEYFRKLAIHNMEGFEVIRDGNKNILGIINNSDKMPQAMRSKLLKAKLVYRNGNFKRYELYVAQENINNDNN